jgi:homoserine dehydrogenase
MKEIRIGLLGFGTIGTGVVKIFQDNARLIEERLGARLVLARIADLDITTDRGVSVDADLLTTRAEDVVSAPDIDVVIELIGGYEPARTFVLKAIEQGKHVVTANKALLALWPLLRRRWLKGVLLAYVAGVLFCITVTANHWLLDAVGGVLVVALGYAGAVGIDRVTSWVRARRAPAAVA